MVFHLDLILFYLLNYATLNSIEISYALSTKIDKTEIALSALL